MKHKSALIVLLSGFAGFLQAQEAKDIKPGLWEIQHKTSMDGQALPDMNKMLEQVPPEMRGQMKAMMEKNGAGMTDKGLTICITPEQIANQQYGSDPKGQCQVSDIKHDGNVTHMTTVCSKPKGAGETTVTRLSPEAWTSVSKMTIEEKGAQHTMDSESTAKWLATDCGAVKPVGQQTAEKKKAE
ncbi:MAG TPA: DUF3617 domain-containing protein [Pseudomonadales bacterium]|nr:DUF3617 domain-containing protein [Pseudomonadales bacterium]